MSEPKQPNEVHPPTTSHNYKKRIAKLVPSLPPNKLHEIYTIHEGWCDFLKGSFCNCLPELKIKTYEEKKEGK